MEIEFRGLCAFKRKSGGENVASVSLLRHGGHKAQLIANVKDVEPDEKKTTWPPDRIFSSPDGEPLMIWDIEKGNDSLEVRTIGPSKYWDKDDVLDLTVHQNTKDKDPARVVFTVLGGEFEAETSKYAMELIHDNVGKHPGSKTKNFSDRIQWRGETVAIKSSRGSIAFRTSDPTISVCNEAAEPGNGLAHFEAYDDLFTLEDDDKRTTVKVKPKQEASIDFLSLGWNCINPTEVP